MNATFIALLLWGYCTRVGGDRACIEVLSHVKMPKPIAAVGETE
jgi:hypothetical protein